MVIIRAEVDRLTLSECSGDVFKNVRLLAHVLKKRPDDDCEDALLDVQNVVDEHSIWRELLCAPLLDLGLERIQPMVIERCILDKLGLLFYFMTLDRSHRAYCFLFLLVIDQEL